MTNEEKAELCLKVAKVMGLPLLKKTDGSDFEKPYIFGRNREFNPLEDDADAMLVLRHLETRWPNVILWRDPFNGGWVIRGRGRPMAAQNEVRADTLNKALCLAAAEMGEA